MGQSEGTMDHEGLVLWGEMPFLDFPYAKCYFKMANWTISQPKKRRLPGILAVVFGATMSCFGQKKAIVTPTVDIVRPQRFCFLALVFATVWYSRGRSHASYTVWE